MKGFFLLAMAIGILVTGCNSDGNNEIDKSEDTIATQVDVPANVNGNLPDTTGSNAIPNAEGVIDTTDR